MTLADGKVKGCELGVEGYLKIEEDKCNQCDTVGELHECHNNRYEQYPIISHSKL